MYALHRLTRSSQDFASSFIGNSRSRSLGFSLAIAYVLANTVSVNKEQGHEFFSGPHRQEILSKLSVVNEIFRIDHDKVLDFAKKILSYRQTQAEGTAVISLNSQESSIFDFFGLTRVFSLEDLKVISDNYKTISVDIIKLNDLFSQLGILDVKS